MRKWRKLKSRKIHKNPWYTLREDDVIRPNGSRGKYYVVDINSVAVVAEDDDGKIYLVGQVRYPVGNIFSWELVTGGFQKPSRPLSAAKRELKEETGLLAEKWDSLGYFHPMNGYSSETVFVYLARKLKKGKQELDDCEDIIIKKESVGRAMKMIERNEVTCGITIAAIYRYLNFKKIIPRVK